MSTGNTPRRWTFSIKDLLVATVVVALGLGVLSVARTVAQPREIGDAKALQAGMIGGASMMIGYGLAWILHRALPTLEWAVLGWAIGGVVLWVAVRSIM